MVHDGFVPEHFRAPTRTSRKKDAGVQSVELSPAPKEERGYLREGLARVDSLLKTNEEYEAPLRTARAAEVAWRERAAKDGALIGHALPTRAIYTEWVTGWKRVLAASSDLAQRQLAEKNITYFESSLALLTHAERAADQARQMKRGGQESLYRLYAEQPADVRGAIFLKAIETWPLTTEVKRYAKAILTREQTKEVYIAARDAWYVRNAPEAMEELRTRYTEFKKNANALDSWEAAIQVRSEEPSPERFVDVLKPQTPARRDTALFGEYPLYAQVDAEALAPLEERFQEEQSALFEQRRAADQALVEVCKHVVQRIPNEPALREKLLPYDALRTGWSGDETRLDALVLAKALLRNGASDYLATFAGTLDENLNTALKLCKKVRADIRTAKTKEAFELRDELKEEREALLRASRELQAFEKEERDTVLALAKEEVIAAERAVARTYRQAREQDIDLFHARLDVAVFASHTNVGAVPRRMDSIGTQGRMEEHLKEVGRVYIPSEELGESERSIWEAELVEKSQRFFEGYLAKCIDDLGDETIYSSRVIQVVNRLENEVLTPFPSPQASGFAERIAAWERFSPFPKFSRASLDHPLAESEDLTAFRKPYSQLNESAFEEQARKGTGRIVEKLRSLITKLERIDEQKVKRVSVALRMKYAAVLQA